MADKIVLNKALGTYDVVQINNNFDKIAKELNDNVLYRQNPSGGTNTMKNNLDMNGFHILNLPAPGSSNEAARLKDVTDAIAGLGGQTANTVGFEPAGSITADNVQGAIVELDGDLQAVITRTAGQVSIKEFGAIGDEVVDDTPAFTAAEASTYSIIYLPEGNYKVSVPPKKTYIGPGQIVTSGVSQVLFTGTGDSNLTVTGNYGGAFPIKIKARISKKATTQANTTGFSVSNGIGTLSHSGGTYAVGSWIQISGMSVGSDSVNGRHYVLSSAAGQVTFYTTATGPQTVAGTIKDFDEFELSFNDGATYVQTYQTYDPITDNDKSVRYTCNTYAGQLDIITDATRVFGFANLFMSWASGSGHNVGDVWSFTLTPPATVLYTEGNSLYLNGDRAITVETNRSIGIGSGVFGNLNSIGVENIGIGVNALRNNTTGYANIGIGADAITHNERGGANIGIGAASLYSNVEGSDNVAIGLYSQYTTLGSNNVSMGIDSLRQNRSGSNNVAIGTQAMYSVEGGTENVAVGLYALRGGSSSFPTGITNVSCTAVGTRSLQLATNTNGNTGVGLEALYKTTGSYNTAIGMDAGFSHVGGSYNVFIGYNAGNNASQAVAPLNSIAIGDSSYVTGSNAVAIGSGVVGTVNSVRIGNAYHSNVGPGVDNGPSSGGPGNRWSAVYAASGTINTSDENCKEQIQDIEEAVLRAWGKVSFMQYKFKDAVAKKGDGARWHFGVIAQRVKEAFESEGLDAFTYGVLCYDEWEEDGEVKSRYGIRYEEALALECAYLRSKLGV